MSQTLFLKSNLLHIRTNEGEFEVSNQNELHYDEEEDAFILNGTKSINWEWPGGVELIHQILICDVWCDCSYSKYLENSDDPKSIRQVARLLPKEEFKPAQPTPNFPKGGTTFTESAYKEWDQHGEKCFCNACASERNSVESSEPQEKEPTAYQKRKAIEKRAVWLKYCLDIGWTKDQLNGLEKIWDQHHDEFGNLIKGVSAPSESQEDMGHA